MMTKVIDSSINTGNSKNKPLILLVDDDEVIQRFLNMLLIKEGYVLLLARDRTETFRVLARHKPSLLLIDINLGDDHGGYLCEEIKNSTNYSSLPVLLISGYPLSADDCSKYKADGFLTKPMDLAVFKSEIKKYIKSD